MSEQQDTYGLSETRSSGAMAAPALPYQPRLPRSYSPRIGLIGCGGITETHLRAYRQDGLDVVALCSRDIAKAEARRVAFYPEAVTTTDYRDILARDDIEVVDITTHPAERVELIEAALNAGKHVLSQKPFVLDLDIGERLVELADARGVQLAVNQNGRWAPHFSYMRQAIAAGLIGDVTSQNFCIEWDHNWIKDLVFNNIHHAVLYDFAIHWFDISILLFNGKMPRRVTASVSHSPTQLAAPPLLAQAIVEFDNGQATFAFNADTRLGSIDRTHIIGTGGVLRSEGPSLSQQTVSLTTAEGSATPELTGTWFPDGFRGTMGELLCAIEEGREPSNSARHNLKSLELCFAACASADTGLWQVPGEVRQVPPSCIAE